MPARKPDSYTRAYRSLIHHLMQFASSTTFEVNHDDQYVRTSGGLHGFVCCNFMATDREARPGDLVRLSSAPETKWTLGWLVEIDNPDPTKRDPRWLIASAEDGETCWWTNVQVDFFQRQHVQQRWRWTDRQFDFHARWMRVVRKIDGDVIRSYDPKFDDDGPGVTLFTRRHIWYEKMPRERYFPDWRKVTRADMISFMNDVVAEHEAEMRDNRARNTERTTIIPPTESRPL